MKKLQKLIFIYFVLTAKEYRKCKTSKSEFQVFSSILYESGHSAGLSRPENFNITIVRLSGTSQEASQPWKNFTIPFS